MFKNSINKKILRYLTGECNEVERRKIESWINKNDKNKKKFNLHKRTWEEITTNHINWEVDFSWNKFASDHEIYNRNSINDHNTFVDKRRHVTLKDFYRRYNYMIRVAAVLLIMAVGAFVLYRAGLFGPEFTGRVVWKEKFTGMGEKSYLSFTDGTKIILNAGSRLKYPAGFNGDKREVYLEGEAYFVVNHDDKKPFIVRTGKFTTFDLGTVFNVKAYPNENNFSVAVVSGKVKITEDKDNSQAKEIILKPSLQFTHNKITGVDNIKEFDYFQVIGWKDNLLIFKDRPMKEVLTVLYRTYGIQIDLADTAFYKWKINANFENESFWTVIKAMKAFTKLEYKAESDKNGKLTRIIFSHQNTAN